MPSCDKRQHLLGLAAVVAGAKRAGAGAVAAAVGSTTVSGRVGGASGEADELLEERHGEGGRGWGVHRSF